MASKSKLSLLCFLTFSLLFLASQCYQIIGREADHENVQNPQMLDPKKQYERCKRECELYKEEAQKELKQYCKDRCEDRYEEQKQQEEEREQRGGGSGTIGATENHNFVDQALEKKYKQRQQKCQSRKGEAERERCKQERLEECREEREREGRGGRRGESGEEENQEGRRGEREQQQGENPYFFEGQRFKTRFRTEAGEFKVLERFSKGEGTLSFVHHERRESFNLERGDAIKLPAGSTAYMINRHNNEKLQIFMLVHPISTPGKFEASNTNIWSHTLVRLC